MSGRLGNYLDLVATAQKKRLEITLRQEKQIAKIYLQTADEYARAASHYDHDSLTYRWLTDYARALQRGSRVLYSKIGKITAASALEAAQAAAGAERQFYSSMAPYLSRQFSDVFSNIPQQVTDELMSGGIYKNFVGLSTKIWDYQKKYKRDISTIITQGISQQKSAFDLSKDLELYLRPEAKKPWNWGIVYPGCAQKVDYCAQRLARTSVSHAYQLSFQRTTQDNPFVEKYQWHSSNSGRVCPLCRQRDGRLYDRDKLPLDHPNGMCVITAVISKSYDEIGAELGDWAAGESDNPALDRWLGIFPSESGYTGTNISRIGSNRVDLSYIKSTEFRSKFSRLTENSAVNDSIRRHATAMLINQNGTDGEDLCIIDELPPGRSASKSSPSRNSVRFILPGKSSTSARDVPKKKRAASSALVSKYGKTALTSFFMSL